MSACPLCGDPAHSLSKCPRWRTSLEMPKEIAEDMTSVGHCMYRVTIDSEGKDINVEHIPLDVWYIPKEKNEQMP